MTKNNGFKSQEASRIIATIEEHYQYLIQQSNNGMKPTISKKTQDYLNFLEQKDSDQPDYYYGEMDAIDRLIYKDELRIKAMHFHQNLDLMLVILNDGKVLQRTISFSQRLHQATMAQLNHYEFIGGGTGVHWPEVDEDLRLRGFLEEELFQVAKPLSAAS